MDTLSYCRNDEIRKLLHSIPLVDSNYFARRGHIGDDCLSGCSQRLDFLTRRVFSPRDNHHRVTAQNRYRRLSGEGKCLEWLAPARLNTMRPEHVGRASNRTTITVQPNNKGIFRARVTNNAYGDGMTGYQLCGYATQATGGVFCSSSKNQGYHLKERTI